MGRRLGCQPTSGCPVASRAESALLVVLVSHAVFRNELFLHRDSIMAKLRKLPGCAEIKGLALRSG